jgi:hypothetical protein
LLRFYALPFSRSGYSLIILNYRKALREGLLGVVILGVLMQICGVRFGVVLKILEASLTLSK